MQPSTIFAILASAAMATALPNYGGSGQTHTVTVTTTAAAAASTSNSVCSNNQKLACCNSPAGVSVLGGACTLAILSNICAAGSTQCCEADQNGLINVNAQCIPISL
ncbi:hypothetical protein BAUCODRAFT_145709 [Baudoinia panamericana UAMH 10762]|uniref:Hydrophobin n=1 Tax=Baudoinia panamericana (strain UAMH 10762) TaxID=717646 RepID=M2N3V4_BAUPA|nr:uncharacterized protein BAUCODRAFT_145709 [Baudoinia panamericana UAMH 10762]EMC98663.1 hypothetical protein BAUCODRAFT_145709 [Baudoinia panamericana UAMH 10762]